MNHSNLQRKESSSFDPPNVIPPGIIIFRHRIRFSISTSPSMLGNRSGSMELFNSAAMAVDGIDPADIMELSVEAVEGVGSLNEDLAL